MTLIFAAVLSPACAQDLQSTSFIDLSLEELSEFRVTSVSRKEERLADTAASVYVITGDMLRRAGIHTLPEALRLAPNLQVAQTTSFQYAISARGHNDITSNKLLVMIDGRTVFTPLYSGVFWDAHDVMIADVDRIEVISGPAGVVWGTNAVNGVINIIMKPADALRGDLAQFATGRSGNSAAWRHGGTIGNENNTGGIAYAVYGKVDSGKRTERASGADNPDEYGHGQVGFRAGWHSGGDHYSVQGDAYRSSGEQAPPVRARLTGGNLMARWDHAMADGASLRVQGYADRTTRDMPGILNEQLNIYDVDVQYHLPERQDRDTIIGGGYRIAYDHVGPNGTLAFLPAQRQLYWANLVVQHEMRWQSGWRVTGGLRAESNNYSGLEWLPSVKVAWAPRDGALWWATLARNVRAPSRIDAEVYFPSRPPYRLVGGPNFRAEVANTVETGWRARVGQSLSWSLVGFHTQYQRLRSVDMQGSTFVIGNQVHGFTQGIEAQAMWMPQPGWTFEAGALLLHEEFKGGLRPQTRQGSDPAHQLRASVRWHALEQHDVQLTLREVGRLPPAVSSNPLTASPVPSYALADLQWTWRPQRNVDVTVAARNLFDRRHREFGGLANPPQNTVMLGRVVDAVLTIRF
ncbi:TonB-dependent receptor plug domain-containing protein [Pseudoduganella rivuli]|nr:TonB-dependent receptor [Pseudoduganella rivuli]